MKLTLEHIYFRDVFKDLTFAFETGKMTLLIGDTGVGKSTLFRILTNFNELDFSGEVKLGDTLLSHLPIHKRVTYLSMMFQNPSRQFTMPTLYEELIFTLENLQTPSDQIDEKIQHAIALGKVEHLLHRDFLTLSGGEKQQVSLAVLLAMDSQIILLDEPFASVDQEARKRLIHLLSDLTKMGKTVILCDHDRSLYADCVDHLVELKNGELFERDVALLKKELPSYQLARENTQRNPLLQLQHVSCQFDSKILFTIEDFTFQQGITTLIGANGAGKSTLFRAILQLQKYKGNMSYQGRKLKKSKQLYRHITAVVQDAEKQFIRTTPAEELNLSSLSSENQAKVQEALDLFGLADKMDSSLFHLSGGQKKIIQLLAILTLETPVILMDEPFTGLDKKACDFFANWIREKATQQSFIIISHRLESLDGISDYLVELTSHGLTERRAL